VGLLYQAVGVTAVSEANAVLGPSCETTTRVWMSAICQSETLISVVRLIFARYLAVIGDRRMMAQFRHDKDEGQMYGSYAWLIQSVYSFAILLIASHAYP